MFNEIDKPTISDHIREGIKDLELEYRIRKHDVQQGYYYSRQALRAATRGTGIAARERYHGVYHGIRSGLLDSKEAVRETYQETGNVIRLSCRTVRREAQELSLEIKQEAREIIEFGKGLSSKFIRPRRYLTSPSGSTRNFFFTPHPPPSEGNTQLNSTHEERQQVIEAIRVYEASLKDPSFIVELNNLIKSKLTSASEMIEYYQARSELKDFTLNTELPRMKYIVHTHRGKKLTKVHEIVEYGHSQTEEEQNQDVNSTHSVSDDILWRAANQSIFGDVISCLTTPAALIRPQLGMATFVDDINVLLDFRRDDPALTAECYINVSIPNMEGNRLSLGGVLVSIYFSPCASELDARILHISPSPSLPNKELESVADGLICGFD